MSDGRNRSVRMFVWTVQMSIESIVLNPIPKNISQLMNKKLACWPVMPHILYMYMYTTIAKYNKRKKVH